MENMPSHTPRDLNQAPPFADVNLYKTDRVLQDAVHREGAAWADAELASFGEEAGSAHALELGHRANEAVPQLEAESRSHGANRFVAYDPAYHELMTISMKQALHCSTWEYLRDGGSPEAGRHVARAAAFYLAAQMEAGHCCPVTMTHAAVPVLQVQPDLLETWLPKILSREYDPAFAPLAEKKSATIGMGMTEIQGGTDVSANITMAEPVSGGGPGGEYLITGHKFFMSAPMCDAFLVLAQAPGGLSCFLMPRFRTDGSVNALHFVQLKDKLGNRSNASSEVEFHGAFAWLVGEEGRGVRNILQMVTLTRLDCAVSSAGLMRFALAHAIHHCRHRTVFGKKLVDQPMMARVLADMALHVEAATLFVFRLVRAYDNDDDEKEVAWQRLMTPVAKYWICKTAPGFAYEAMECLGGNGYVEDASPLARVYREVPVNAIWEGSGNVMCLDVMRVIERQPESMMHVLEDLAEGAKGDRRLEGQLARIRDLLATGSGIEGDGRVLTGLLAELAAGVLTRAHTPDDVSSAYLSSRFSQGQGRLFGEAQQPRDAHTILDRALPE